MKSNLEVKLYKMCPRVKVNQFRVENTHVKMLGMTLLSFAGMLPVIFFLF